jgi:hypothetical protein
MREPILMKSYGQEKNWDRSSTNAMPSPSRALLSTIGNCTRDVVGHYTMTF